MHALNFQTWFLQFLPSDHIFLWSFISFLRISYRTWFSAIPSGSSSILPLKFSNANPPPFHSPFSVTPPILASFSLPPLILASFSLAPPILASFSLAHPILASFSVTLPFLASFSLAPPILFSSAKPPSSLVLFSNAPPESSFSARLLSFLALLWYADLTQPFLFQVVQYIYLFQSPQVF